MASIQHSKYRHAFTDEPKQQSDKFCDLPKPFESPESNVISASSKWVAMAKIGGGGPVVIRKLGKMGHGRAQTPMLNNHTGKVTDMVFSPFNPDLLFTGSEDCTINVTQLIAPEDESAPGMHADLAQRDSNLFTLEGHKKKVSFVAAHTTAENIIASSSWDKTVRIWDLEEQKEVYSNGDHPHTTFCLEWNRNGSLLGTTCKDHKLRIFDPRVAGSVREVSPFDSSKCSKIFWVPKYDWIGCFGFTKQSKRMLKMYDVKNFADPIHVQQIDQSSSIVFPMWDDETDLLWTWSKGDGSMGFSEITNKNGPLVKSLGVHRSSVPTKGGCFIPKVALDTEKCEVARFLKLTNNPAEIVPLSFVVPRKNQGFADDLFPDCPGTEATQTAEGYRNGIDADPKFTSMDPSTLAAAIGKKIAVKLTYAQMKQENDELKARVAELEAQLGTN